MHQSGLLVKWRTHSGKILLFCGGDEDRADWCMGPRLLYIYLAWYYVGRVVLMCAIQVPGHTCHGRDVCVGWRRMWGRRNGTLGTWNGMDKGRKCIV